MGIVEGGDYGDCGWEGGFCGDGGSRVSKGEGRTVGIVGRMGRGREGQWG